MMTKSEIISTTLDELLERALSNPEAFEYIKDYNISHYSGGDETIIWRTMVNSGGQLINDPTMQQKTIVIIFDSTMGSIKIKMYNQCIESNITLNNTYAEAEVESKKIFKVFRNNYRKFSKLRKLILNAKTHKEAREFLKKLSTTFPSVLDKHIFGK